MVGFDANLFADYSEGVFEAVIDGLLEAIKEVADQYNEVPEMDLDKWKSLNSQTVVWDIKNNLILELGLGKEIKTAQRGFTKLS